MDRQLFGRDPELARLKSLVSEVVAGRGAAVWVAGEPGIGKSALLSAGLSAARDQGCRVLWASADELDQQFPLRVLVECFDDPERMEIVGEGPLGVDPVLASVERLIVLVEHLCAKFPVVLALDDLQWADESSLLVWNRLSRSIEQLPLLLVSACRPVPRRHEVVRLRNALVERDVDVIELSPLPPPAVGSLVDTLAGGHAGPRLHQLAERAGGNPLFVRVLVDAVSLEHGAGLNAGVEDLPSSLPGVISGWLGFLPGRTLEVLRGAALLGNEFSVAELATVLARLVTELWEQLEEALVAGVLVEAGAKLAFGHPLVRQAIYEAIPAGLRSALHHQAAKSLAGAGGPTERIAAQLLVAPDVIDAWTLDWIATAGPELTNRAPTIAVELLRRALDRLPAEDRRREETEGLLMDSLRVLARHDDTEQLARHALARNTSSPHRTRMAVALAHSLMGTARAQEALDVIVDGLAGAMPGDPWTPRLRALCASFLPVLGREAEAERVARQALAEAEAIGDSYATGYALHALSIDVVRQDSARALRLMDRGVAVLGDDAESVDLRLLISCNRIWLLRTLDRPAEANEVLSANLALAESTGTPRLQIVHTASAMHRFFLGEWDDAGAEIEVVLANVDDLPERRHTPDRARGLAALIAAHRDDRAAVSEHLGAMHGFPALGGLGLDNAVFLMLARAYAAERNGEPGAALTCLLPALQAEHSEDMILRHLVMPSIVRLAVALEDQTTARAAADACAAHAERDALPVKLAAANRCRGFLANDPGPVAEAVAYYRTVAWPLELAETLEDAAVLHARLGDAAPAKAALGQAVFHYQELGAAWDVKRAESRLRPYGVHRGQRGPRRRPAQGWQALTPTELRVAELVAVGQSNPDIAGELFLSRRTVQTHVSHILAKLGAKSRKEIAQEARRRATR